MMIQHFKVLVLPHRSCQNIMVFGCSLSLKCTSLDETTDLIYQDVPTPQDEYMYISDHPCI